MIVNTMLRSFFLGSLIYTLHLPQASAEGLLDDLDYCIEARQEFDRDSYLMRSEVSKATQKGLAKGPSVEFGRAWWRRTFVALYKSFDEKWGDLIRQSDGDVSKGFLTWWNAYGLEQNGGPEGLKRSMEQSYERFVLEEERENSRKVDAALSSRRKNLSENCKEDLGSQIIRVTEAELTKVIEGALSPGEVIVANWDNAVRVGGIGAKIVQDTTGIPLEDAWRDTADVVTNTAETINETAKDVVEDLICLGLFC